jgi:acyl-ACP thioesterase
MVATEFIHYEDFRVRSYETNVNGVASAQTICNYLQEVAGNHATKLGVGVDQLLKKNLTWVLSRLHVQFFRYPQWREIINIETWPSGKKGKFATRDFIVFDKNNEIIVKATSSWMLLDFSKMRTITMPDFIEGIELPDRERAIVDDFPKLPQPQNTDIKRQFDVRLSDLDINQHVNHVKYIDWALESIPLSVWKKRHLSQLEISFRSETRYGEGIIVQTEQDENIFLHQVISEKDQRGLAVLRTHWKGIDGRQ